LPGGVVLHLAVDHDRATAVRHGSENLGGKSDLAWIGREYALGDRHLARMKRPGADAAHEKCVAELRFAGGAVGESAEWTVERLDPCGGASVDHLGNGVMPKVLLKFGTWRIGCSGIRQYLVIGVATTNTCRFHGPRSGKVGGAQTHAVHPRRGRGNYLDIIDAFRPFQDGVD